MTIGAKPNKVFNSLVQGTAVLAFSRLPILLDDTISTTALQCNIKKYAITDIVAEMQFDHGPMGTMAIVPNASQNDFSRTELAIDFILDSDMNNYNLLYRWLDVYKRLTYRTDKNTADGKHWDAKQAFCPYVDIAIFDNRKTIKNLIRFYQVFINTVGSLEQDFGSDAPIIFTCRFNFNQFLIYNTPDNINEVIGDYI
jgi:hypothetical protein